MTEIESRTRVEGFIFLVLFCLTIPVANWMIGHVGTACAAGGGPCLLLAPASLVIASSAAFLFSEFADFAVYTPLARRRLVLAVFASGLAGLVVDSLVFLWLAFGSLEFLEGQIVGKLWMVLLAMPLIAYLRRRDERLGLTPA